MFLRWIRRIPVMLALVLVFAMATAAQGVQDTFHDPRMKAPIGFSVDLEYPADVVLTFVRNAANASIIRGTRIYRKDKSNEIDGAEFAATSKVFTDTPASGQVFYKVKKNAIAPEHFPGSNGAGSVIVRYVVQPAAPERMRLLIDAVYFQESLRARYFSDGSVESAEYEEIRTQLSAYRASLNTTARPVQTAAPIKANTQPVQTAALIKASTQPVQTAVPAQNSAGPQSTLVREQGLLGDAEAARQKLQEQLKQL